MNGWSPLHCAADGGHFVVCEVRSVFGIALVPRPHAAQLLLQQSGIKITPNKDGNGPLVYLVRQKLAGDVNLYTFFNVFSISVFGRLHVHVLLLIYSNNTPQVLNLMIEKGVDVNATNRYGEVYMAFIFVL